jgi:hypothetical protein
MENIIINDFEYGKCLLSQPIPNILSEEFKNLSFEHALDCPFETIYKNKTEIEIYELKSYYNKLGRVKFASVGIIQDNQVNLK